jgi:hypothetical protein
MEIRPNDPVLPALAAMAASAARFDAGAARVATTPEDTDALIGATLVAPVTYAANARVVRTATDTTGSLLDALA